MSLLTNLLASNPLLLRDYRIFRNGLIRNPFAWAIVILSSVQILITFNLDAAFGADRSWDRITEYYAWPTIFLLQIVTPLWAFTATRRHIKSGELPELLATRLPAQSPFWWLWCRVWIPTTIIALMLCLPLTRLLAEVGDMPSQWTWFQRHMTTKATYYFISEIFSNLAIAAIFIAPFTKSRSLRAFLFLFVGIIALASLYTATYAYSNLDLRDFLVGRDRGYTSTERYGLGMMPMPTFSYSFLGPTLLYVLVSAAFSSGLGTYLAHQKFHHPGKALYLLFLCGPLLENVMINPNFIQNFGILISRWTNYHHANTLFPIYGYYMMTAGYLWLGVKWNILLAMSRREIRLDD